MRASSMIERKIRYDWKHDMIIIVNDAINN